MIEIYYDIECLTKELEKLTFLNEKILLDEDKLFKVEDIIEEEINKKLFDLNPIKIKISINRIHQLPDYQKIGKAFKAIYERIKENEQESF